MIRLRPVISALVISSFATHAYAQSSTENSRGYEATNEVNLEEVLMGITPADSQSTTTSTDMPSGGGSGLLSVESPPDGSANGESSGTPEDATLEEQEIAKSEEAIGEKAVQDNEAGKKQGRLFSEEIWIDSFEVGYSLMPEYNEEGENEGFDEGNVFARFSFDSRFREDTRGAWHAGLSAAFFSSNIGSCPDQESDSDTGGSDTGGNAMMAMNEGDDNSGNDGNGNGNGNGNGQEMEDTECDPQTDLSDVKFTDVADTLRGSVYLWKHWRIGPTKLVKDGDDLRRTLDSSSPSWFEVGVGARASIQSREKLDDNGDSINSIYAGGVRIVMHDFRSVKNKNGKTNKNGLPRLLAEAMVSEYEDFAGVDDATRYLFNARWRVKDELPWYLGLHVNSGEGPDEIALTINYGVQLAEFFDFAGRAP